MSINLPGVGSGLDINSLVQQLVAAEREPTEQRLRKTENETRTQISALGALRSALSSLDATLKKFEGTGGISSRKATVGDGAGFAASASNSAAVGEYQVEVERLASAQKWQSAPVALNNDGSRAQLGHGRLTITLGDQAPITVEITQGQGTLADIRDAINDQGGALGVSATLVRGDAGEVLVLSSNRLGSDSALQVTTSGGDGGLAVLDTVTGTMTEKSPAQDAVVIVDGVRRTVASNTVTDAIEGVTLTLTEAAAGRPFTLEIGTDAGALKSAFDEFLKAYNAALGLLRTQTDPGKPGSSGGPLRGDAAARGLLQSLRNTLGTHYAEAARLGLKTATDGTLSLDASKFDAALTSDPLAARNLLSKADGLGAALRARLEDYIGTDGVLDTRSDTLNDRLRRVTTDREALDRRMGSLEARLRAQYTAMDTFIAQLNATSQFLVQRLSQ